MVVLIQGKKNAGYNNYFVETEIECANYSGKKQNIYIDNDGFNRFYPKYSKSGSNQDFSTPALRMIAGIKNNHHDNSYDYKNWISPHKKAKIYYYTNKNDIIDEEFILEKRNGQYLVQKFGPIRLETNQTKVYVSDTGYEFSNQLNILITRYSNFDKLFTNKKKLQ